MGSYRAFVRGRRLKLNAQITNYLKEVIAKHTTVGRVPSAPFVVARSGKSISLNDEGVKLLSEGSRQIIDSRKIIREGYTEGYVYHQKCSDDSAHSLFRLCEPHRDRPIVHRLVRAFALL